MSFPRPDEEKLTYSIIGGFFDVYNGMGYGLLEHLYVMALEGELRDRGHEVAREVAVPIRFKGRMLGFQRFDMVVDGKVIVEAKSTALLPKIATRQLYNYLKVSPFETGLLLHFGPKPDFHRVILRNYDKQNLRQFIAPKEPCR